MTNKEKTPRIKANNEQKIPADKQSQQTKTLAGKKRQQTMNTKTFRNRHIESQRPKNIFKNSK